MPTMTIYRENKLIWSKEFDPPENGRIELDEPVAVEKGDEIFFCDKFGTVLSGYRAADDYKFNIIFYHMPDEDPEPPEPFILDYGGDGYEVDIEFPSGKIAEEE